VNGIQVVTEPHRSAILRLIWERERPAGEIASQFDVTFGAVSQHLAVLRDAGFVDVRRVGNRRLYRAAPERIGSLRAVLEAMWATELDRLATAVEEDRHG